MVFDPGLHARLRAFWARWPWQWVRVEGQSMWPTLYEGDIVLLRAPRAPLPRLGQVVKVTDPRDGRALIKRVSLVTASHFEVRGDHWAASRDSRHFGPLTRQAWDAVAVLRIGLDPLRVRIL